MMTEDKETDEWIKAYLISLKGVVDSLAEAGDIEAISQLILITATFARSLMVNQIQAAGLGEELDELLLRAVGGKKPLADSYVS